MGALAWHLSPAKDVGWENHGTRRQVQTPFTLAPAGSVQAEASLRTERKDRRTPAGKGQGKVGGTSGWKLQHEEGLEGVGGKGGQVWSCEGTAP